MAVPLRLKVFKGNELITTRDFERDMIKIGRLSTAHLCLDDEKASRIHSVLNVEGDGKVSVVDMGSVEGTYLNGKRVNKGFVEFGDEIRIGGTRIVVERGGATEALQAAAGAEAAVVAAAAAMHVPEETTVVTSPPCPVRPEATAPAPARLEETAPAPVPPPPEEAFEAVLEAPASEPEGSRERIFKFEEKSFGSFVPEAPKARRAPKDAKQIGLQIRYLWGDQLLQVSQYPSACTVYVGSTRRSDFHIESDRLGEEEYPLIVPSGDAFAVNVGPGMIGELDRNGESRRLGVGVQELRPTDFAWLDLGCGIRVELSFAAQPRKVAVPLSESIDFRFLNLFLLLAFVIGAFAITASTRTEADVVADDLTMNRLVIARFLIKEAERPKRNMLLERLSDMRDPLPGEPAERHKGDEGKMGRKDIPANKTNRSAPKAIDINAKELVKNSGLLKSLGSGGGGGLSTIFGQGGLGGDLKGAIGNMYGSRVGDAGGMGGLGLKGSGSGGGGLGNTIGIGGIGTKGRGGGVSGFGSGVGSLTPKKSVDVGISSDDSVVQGSLDKELIRQVIRRNIGQIRYCYENELQTRPQLAGKVAVRFVIAPNGDVQTAKVTEGTTMSEANLHECLLVRVRSWKFPSPKGGGSVIVTYPFVFKQSGE